MNLVPDFELVVDFVNQMTCTLPSLTRANDFYCDFCFVCEMTLWTRGFVVLNSSRLKIFLMVSSKLEPLIRCCSKLELLIVR